MPEDFWEQSWKRDKDRDFLSYAKPYYRLTSPEIEFFREHHVRSVCDAGCGYGAYALALASNGFDVTAFDVSATAVEITGRVLKRYGLKLAGHKTASTPYEIGLAVTATNYKQESTSLVRFSDGTLGLT